jgi:hypothetical protein
MKVICLTAFPALPACRSFFEPFMQPPFRVKFWSDFEHALQGDKKVRLVMLCPLRVFLGYRDQWTVQYASSFVCCEIRCALTGSASSELLYCGMVQLIFWHVTWSGMVHLYVPYSNTQLSLVVGGLFVCCAKSATLTADVHCPVHR